MRAEGIVGLVLLAGCHSVFSIDEVGGAGADGGAAPDARVCAPGSAFGAGVAVSIDGMYSVEAARFAPDLSLAYLSLCPADGSKLGCELYLSLFSAAIGQFTTHNALSGINTTGVYDSYPAISPDGQYLLFASRRTTDVLQLWVAHKQNGSFDAPRIDPLALVPNQEFASEPYLLGDGNTLYFAGGFDASNVDYDLYRATGGPPGFGGTAAPVPGTVSSANEQAGVTARRA